MNMQIKDKLGNRVPDLYNSPSDMAQHLNSVQVGQALKGIKEGVHTTH